MKSFKKEVVATITVDLTVNSDTIEFKATANDTLVTLESGERDSTLYISITREDLRALAQEFPFPLPTLTRTPDLGVFTVKNECHGFEPPKASFPPHH